MDNHSMEIINKNITQNNIEKIKKSMKRLKDTINRSYSNNYRNIELKQTINNREKILNEYYIDDSSSLLYYNIKDSFNNEDKIYTPIEHDYITNIDMIKKSPSIPNNHTDFNIINKHNIDKSFNKQNFSNFNYILTNQNDNNDLYSPYFGSRNKYSINVDSITDKMFDEIEVKKNNFNISSINTPKLNEFYPDLLNKENSIVFNKNENKYNNTTNYNKIIRNKSAKQMKIIKDLINSNNIINNNFTHFNTKANNLNDDDNIMSNHNFLTLNNFKDKDEYLLYLKHILYNLENINKGLLQRYKKIIKNFKSANEQNNILMIKINELKLKEQKIRNDNTILEKEYINIKNDLFNNNKNIDKDNEYKKNEELKNRINKYDNIILNLKNQIKTINNNENKNSKKKYDNTNSTLEEFNDDVDIINDLEQKIEKCYKELNEQEKIMNINKKEYEKLLELREDMDTDMEMDKNHYDNNSENENNEYINYINELKKEINDINNQINIIDKSNNDSNK